MGSTRNTLLCALILLFLCTASVRAESLDLRSIPELWLYTDIPQKRMAVSKPPLPELA